MKSEYICFLLVIVFLIIIIINYNTYTKEKYYHDLPDSGKMMNFQDPRKMMNFQNPLCNVLDIQIILSIGLLQNLFPKSITKDAMTITISLGDTSKMTGGLFGKDCPNPNRLSLQNVYITLTLEGNLDDFLKTAAPFPIRLSESKLIIYNIITGLDIDLNCTTKKSIYMSDISIKLSSDPQTLTSCNDQIFNFIIRQNLGEDNSPLEQLLNHYISTYFKGENISADFSSIPVCG